MSKLIKPLKWIHRKFDNTVHADPIGMRWSYYIKPTEANKKKYQLAYVENNGDFVEHGIEFDNLELAQKIATEHYHQLISANILS